MAKRPALRFRTGRLPDARLPSAVRVAALRSLPVSHSTWLRFGSECGRATIAVCHATAYPRS